ncbi:MAG: sigma-70 family RNA polymerase sigma factor [Actinobacteria bacterium]|nr:sigma-70 family RNA polymerase sigma factor [Actinomycetota bacterium]
MDDGQRRRGSGAGAEDLILRTVAAHADSLLRTARRFSLCPDDAQDAYQRTLEIFMAHADRLDLESAAGWLHVVVKREAQAIRRSRQRTVACDDVDFDKYESRSSPTADERLASFDLVGRAAEALQRLKPQELRALWLKAQGHSYNEISALTGWSYTKVNRCLTEGRRSFLSRYATIESGAECALWLPVISAMVDGEASADQLMALRPHLRNCPGCRTTLKTLQGSWEPLAAVLPVPLAGAAAGEEHLMNLFTRVYETVAAGFHERAVYSLTKAQTAFEAASAGKLAAVAASAAAVAGGGYATVERDVPRRSAQDQPAKVVARQPVRHPRRTVPVPTASASPVRKATPPKRPRTAREFGTAEFGPVARKNATAPEFTAVEAEDPQFTRAAATHSSAAAGAPSSTPSSTLSAQPSAPEFGGARAAPEFGG